MSTYMPTKLWCSAAEKSFITHPFLYVQLYLAQFVHLQTMHFTLTEYWFSIFQRVLQALQSERSVVDGWWDRKSCADKAIRTQQVGLLHQLYIGVQVSYQVWGRNHYWIYQLRKPSAQKCSWKFVKCILTIVDGGYNVLKSFMSVDGIVYRKLYLGYIFLVLMSSIVKNGMSS